MEIYWEKTRKGQKLILCWEEKEEMIGAIRETKTGFDAFAKTFTMTPERATKGIGSLNEAREFVEYFRPWELFTGPVEMSVETDVREPK